MRKSLWIATLVLMACSKASEPTTGSAGSAGSGIGSGPGSATAREEAIEIFINDKSVAKVTKAQLASWPRLDSLVPEDARRLGTWQQVQVKGATSEDIDRPSSTHPDKVAALYPGTSGLAFGMFDPVELARKGKPIAAHDGVREVRIKVQTEGRGGDHQGGEVTDPTKLVLTIKTKAGDKTLTGEQILALPREPAPGQEDNKGWRVRTLLEAAGITSYKKLVLADASGVTVTLDKAELEDKATVPFVKLNRSGALRFRVMKKQGEGWQTAGDLRGLATIKVE